jgi:hypothetical protein
MKTVVILFLASLVASQSCNGEPAPEMSRLAGTYDDTTNATGQMWFTLKADGTYYLSRRGAGKSGEYTVSHEWVVLKASEADGSSIMFIIDGDNLNEALPDRQLIRIWARRTADFEMPSNR